jgi:toxin ParE1/3/4
VRPVYWTNRARSDLAAISAFIEQDSSPHYAEVVVARLIDAPKQIAQFPESGRMVPEYGNPTIRELIRPPFRIVYRLVGSDAIHILTVSSQCPSLPAAAVETSTADAVIS